MPRVKFHANLMNLNFDWLAKEALRRGISMNAALNDLLAGMRRKSGTEQVQPSSASERIQ